MSRKFATSKVSHDRWLVSYADFITLLFAFFVVLYAFAKADEKRQAQVAAAIASGFQSLSAVPVAQNRTDTNRSTDHSPTQQIPDLTLQEDLGRIRSDLEQRLAIQIANRVITVQLNRQGLVISLREAGFFNSGSAEPKPDTTPVLHRIADALRNSRYDVRVEGHTDNRPIHNAEFDSNWELSSARAVRITRMFLALHAVPAEQLSAEGFAEYRPVSDNTTVQGRAENRRVDIVVLPRALLDLSATPTVESRHAWRKITDDDREPTPLQAPSQ